MSPDRNKTDLLFLLSTRDQITDPFPPMIRSPFFRRSGQSSEKGFSKRNCRSLRSAIHLYSVYYTYLDLKPRKKHEKMSVWICVGTVDPGFVYVTWYFIDGGEHGSICRGVVGRPSRLLVEPERQAAG